MDRGTVEQRLKALQGQLAHSEQIFEQIKGNINAIRGAIQFAEDLLKSDSEPKDNSQACPEDPVPLVQQGTDESLMQDALSE